MSSSTASSMNAILSSPFISSVVAAAASVTNSVLSGAATPYISNQNMNSNSTATIMMIEEIFTAATRTAKAHTVTQHQSEVSPVTLSSDWSRVARLLMLASLSVIGSVGNVFMISAVMIEDHLKKKG